MKTVGLTLGKFAPFHKGHQHLVETALSEVEHLIVLVYDSPQVTSVPLPVRANWIRGLYPEVEVIEGWEGPPDSGHTPEIMRKQEEYVLRILLGRKVTHFYSSEFYGDHMSKALGAQNRLVDNDREKVPVSATAIRNDPYKHREFLSPNVYRDLIVNVVFLGAPSTGKTTIAEDCAKHFSTVWMPEYGREYWEEHQVERRLTLEQLVEIAEGHLERENALLCNAKRFLFTDTNAITTFMFSQYYHGKAHDRLELLAHQVEKRYDLVFLCDFDIPYDNTWDRSGEANRETFQKQIIADLAMRKIPYILLSGNREERLKKVVGALIGFEKYSNLWEVLSRQLSCGSDRPSWPHAARMGA